MDVVSANDESGGIQLQFVSNAHVSNSGVVGGWEQTRLDKKKNAIHRIPFGKEREGRKRIEKKGTCMVFGTEGKRQKDPFVSLSETLVAIIS